MVGENERKCLLATFESTHKLRFVSFLLSQVASFSLLFYFFIILLIRDRKGRRKCHCHHDGDGFEKTKMVCADERRMLRKQFSHSHKDCHILFSTLQHGGNWWRFKSIDMNIDTIRNVSPCIKMKSPSLAAWVERCGILIYDTFPCKTFFWWRKETRQTFRPLSLTRFHS